MRARLVSVLIAAVFLACACAQKPKPVSFSFETQKKLQAARHWEILVSDFGSDISKSPELAAMLAGPVKILPDDNSSFGRAFRSFWSTWLVDSGARVTSRDQGSMKLDWSVQNVEHGESGGNRDFPGTTTVMMGIGYGVYKAWDGATDSTAGLLASAAAADVVNEINEASTVGMPRNEIIVNVNLFNPAGELVYRKTNIYYISDMDRSHYFFSPDRTELPAPAPAKRYTVSQ
ncbi:MAG TPA: hypothetical protein PKB11_09685 [Desulfovibrio sp.]|uniref:hypothetical protein n=1 Tax=Desulfovibrio sp. TaxID=885 RepID=UPI002C045F4E|nr:hypothetical protein [Desulfovibrio sp.]HMM39013.1 hypothetical protein [Desulfovibrio sp.]